MKELKRLLLPLKSAVIKNNSINFALAALLAGLVIDIIIAAVSKFVLIADRSIILAAVPAVSVLAALAAANILRPDTMRLCELADSMGLDERCITAYGLLKDCKNDEIHLLEITDTIDRLRRMDFDREYKARPWLFLLKWCGLAAVLLITVTVLPSPRQAELDEQLDVHKKAIEEYEKVEKTADEIFADAETEKEIKKELRSLKGKLAKAKTTQEAVQAIRDSQQELKKIEKENSSLNELSKAMQANENTRALGEALQSGNLEKTKQELKAMNEAIKNMSQEQLSALGKSLSRAAQNISGDTQAKQLLNEMSDALQNSSGDLQEINQLMQQLNDTIEQQSQNNSELKQAVDDMNKALENSANSMQGKPQSGNDRQNSPSHDGESSQNGQQNENGQGNISGAESGENSQSGQNGEGGKNGQGNAPEQGEGNGQGRDSGRGASNGSGRGTGHIDNESIYTKLNGGGSEDVQLSGTENENGEYTKGENMGDGPAGELVPYDTVVEQYKSEALEGASGGNLPSGMESIVKDYFTGLD